MRAPPFRRFFSSSTSSSSSSFDLLVIGGGSGGVATARRASALGIRTALVDPKPLGGTCVNRGCIPKKLYVMAAQLQQELSASRGFGFDTQPAKLHWATLKQRKDAEVSRLNGVYERMVAQAGVEVFRGEAEFAGKAEVLVAGDRISASRIVVATGSRPWIPDIPGAELAMTSDELFELEELPSSIAIVGGGYIACEFSSLLSVLGVKVFQFLRREGDVLRGFDVDVRREVTAALRRTGAEVMGGSRISRLERAAAGKVRVVVDEGKEVLVDAVMFATGRVPLLPKGLKEAGFQVDQESGRIVVDEFSNTSMESVFAIGDVANRQNLTPVAIAEGKAFVETIYKENPTPVNKFSVGTAVFTIPEAASIGIAQEEDAPLRNVRIFKTKFRPLKNTLSGAQDMTLMKLIVCKTSDKVLGCHIVGPGAAELIQVVAVAIQAGATKRDFDKTIAIHPTAAEELVLMTSPSEEFD